MSTLYGRKSTVLLMFNTQKSSRLKRLLEKMKKEISFKTLSDWWNMKIRRKKNLFASKQVKYQLRRPDLLNKVRASDTSSFSLKKYQLKLKDSLSFYLTLPLTKWWEDRLRKLCLLLSMLIFMFLYKNKWKFFIYSHFFYYFLRN